MNPTVEKLILQITWLCLQITSQGKWHAFLEIAGHVRRLDVRLYAADTNYQAERSRELEFSATYQSDPRHDFARDSLAIDTTAAEELQKLLVDLEQYLDLQQLGRDTLAREATQPEVVQ